MKSQLRQLQLTQLEILKVFDRICRENNIKYSLYAGSLLGAVRHQGFIPWDDDLDVCMSRAEYDRFLDLWDRTEHEGYLLQNKEREPNFPQSFSKIRKDHTTFLQDQKEAGQYHTGIFLDIFPIDRIPTNMLARTMFQWNCMQYQLLTREFIPPKGNAIVRTVSKVLLNSTPKSKIQEKRERLLKRITKYNADTTLRTVGIETMASLKHSFCKELVDQYTLLPFEDGMFMCFAEWDSHLKDKFGDYMQLPPEEERAWKHHPVVIDFEHNYEELNLNRQQFN